MKAVVIGEDQFNLMFQKCLDKLALEKFNHDQFGSDELNHLAHTLHRAFHYHVVELRRDLERVGF